jgi:Type IV leader peptidase family.
MILPPVVAVPLMIAAAAIGVTLMYASILDVKERRVPHRTWRPALVIAIPMAVWVYGLTILADWQVAVGYLILVAVFCGFFYFFQAVNLFGGRMRMPSSSSPRASRSSRSSRTSAPHPSGSSRSPC